MSQKYTSIQVFSVSRSGEIRPQQPISHRHKILNVDLSQITTSCATTKGSFQYRSSFTPSLKISTSEINSSSSKPNYQESLDFQPVKNFHKNREKEKRKLAKYIKYCSLIKLIGCFLITLLVGAGIAALIVGLIVINQKNTLTTTTETTVLTTIATSTTTTITTALTTIITTTATTASTTIITTTTITTTPTTIVTTTTVTIAPTTTTVTTAPTTIITTTTVTTKSTTTTTTTVFRVVFALSQVIAWQTVTCSSVDNSNVLYTQCNDFQRVSIYGAGTTSCLGNWSTTLSPYWPATALCQAFIGSATTIAELYYDCSASTSRFTYLNSTWGTIVDTKYTRDVRCYY